MMQQSGLGMGSKLGLASVRGGWTMGLAGQRLVVPWYPRAARLKSLVLQKSCAVVEDWRGVE